MLEVEALATAYGQSQVLFGVYVGVLAWAGLYLRDGRLRSLIPLRRGPRS